MTKIEELLQELCPDGVEYKSLGEVISKNPFKQLGASELESLCVYDGNVKLLPSSKNYDWWTNEETAGNNICEGEVITLGRARYANLKYYKGKFVSANNHIIISKDTNKLLGRFLYHFILSNVDAFYTETSTYPKLDNVIFDNIPIPLPPLEVQEEIVRILDTFTKLEAELEAELEARKKQYSHYRDSLLSFADDANEVSKEVIWKTLGDIGEFIRGNGLQKKDFVESGVGCIHYGQIYTFYGLFANTTKSFVTEELAKKLKKVSTGDLLIVTTSENVEDVCKSLVWLGEDDICISGEMCIFKHNQNPKYIAYYLQTEKFFEHKKRYVTGTKVIRVHWRDIAKLEIPLPPLAEQERIVAILDKFDALVNDITQGLPAEIKARRQQYEYYRDKLLTFSQKS